MRVVQIYAEGICRMSVCAINGISIDEITEDVNTQRPTEIESKWVLDTEGKFATGESMPCPCNTRSNRIHYLFAC